MTNQLDDESFPRADFADVLEANASFAQHFANQNLTGQAARQLAVVTCMDSRIDPLSVLGLKAGDVKILRNAGARVTDDVLRTLMLASYLLDVKRVLVMPHTDCKMASATEEQIHSAIYEEFGVDVRSVEVRVVDNQVEALNRDLGRIRSYPLLPDDLIVGGAIYDVTTGALAPIDG